MDLFRIVRGIASQEKQMTANYKQVQKTEERTKELTFWRGKEDFGRGRMEDQGVHSFSLSECSSFSLAGV